MGIRVKHGVSAGALGASAYTIGRGEKRRWLAELALRRESQNLQAASMVLSAGRSRRQLALQKKSMRLGDERAREERRLRREGLAYTREQDAANRAAAERRWQEEPARQLQKGLQQQELLQQKISWQYDEGQKREMAKITTGVAWLREQVAAGKWTAEQAEKAEQQLWRKYYSIIPLPVYDDTATPQERFSSGRVKDETTGAYYQETSPGKFEPMGSSYKDSANFYTAVAKLYTYKDEMDKQKVDWDGVDEFVRNAEGRIAQRQGLSALAEKIQTRQEEKQEKDAADKQEKEQKIQRKAAVEALPELFKTLIKGQPRIGRVKKGRVSSDKVYGEEAYNKMLGEAVGRLEQEGVPPDIVKAELDKWWDAKYDEERGQTFQKFGNRMEFAEKETERVKMRAPNGEIYEVDRSEVEEAEKHGWKMF